MSISITPMLIGKINTTILRIPKIKAKTTTPNNECFSMSITLHINNQVTYIASINYNNGNINYNGISKKQIDINDPQFLNHITNSIKHDILTYTTTLIEYINRHQMSESPHSWFSDKITKP